MSQPNRSTSVTVTFDIDFANGRMEFTEERCNSGLSFLAQVTPGSGVNGYFGSSTGCFVLGSVIVRSLGASYPLPGARCHPVTFAAGNKQA